ncbi:MAG: IclR family transcriptional regulator [Alphaproteobacteria bacterium]|nr:IclR family transcriptional regulator [Alphaproteobacteria bacterium]
MATPKNQSVLKGFAVLKSFHSPDEWLTSSELSRRAKLPEASGYRIIQTLAQIGAVVRGPRGRYRPGMLLVSLSQNVAIGDLLREASQEIMMEVANRLNLTMHLGILEGGMVTYIAKVCTPTSLALHTLPGSQLEAYCSGIGKVLLAALPPDQLDGVILDGDLVALTPHTITDRAQLRLELDRARKHGYAVDNCEIRLDMRCLAVPIHDGERRTVAALSASDHAELMTDERQKEVRNALLAAAALLERKVFPLDPDLKSRPFQKRKHSRAAGLAVAL